MQTKWPEKLTLGAFIVSTLLGGNNAIAVRFSNVELPPMFGAAIRFTIAAVILFLVVLVLRLPLPRGRALIGVLIFGALQFGASYALIYWSLLTLPAGLFQIILALVPLMTFLLAIVQGQEAFQWKVLIGGLLSLAGIAYIFSDRLSANVPLLPLLASVLAAACIAESIVVIKNFPKSHPVTTNALAMATGAVILTGMSRLMGEVPRLPSLPATWFAVGYLVFFGSIGMFVLALYVIARWKASASAYQLVLMPIVTVLFSAWLLDETLSGALLAGGLMVIVGVYVGALLPPGYLRRILNRRRGGAASLREK